MRYFFDVYNGSTTEDEEGLECSSAEHAIVEAGRAAAGMSVDIAKGGRLSVEVRDAAGPVATITVSIEIARKRPA
ncbi:MAG TPA: hypothetical protein VJT13_27395 [Xanthobacteraceae bacterium]|nr:hypothetical protein [Xanthobacteraceae bacterium]